MEIKAKHNAMLWLCICIAGHFLGAQVAAAPTSDEDLKQDKPYMKELLRQAKTAEIESFMDQKADPCNDFYAFSCGNYNRINSASTMQVVTTGIFETLTKGLNRKILKMLSTPHDTHDTPEDIQVKHFYESCLRIKELNSTYIDKMKGLIAEFGTMPMLEGSSWKEDDFDWLGTSARMAYRYSVTPILACDVSKDFGSNTRNRIYLGQQNFPLESRSMYLDEATAVYRQKYRVNIQRTLQRFLGVNMELAKKTAKELLDFEVDLAKGMVDESEGLDLDELAQLVTVDDIQKRYSPTLDIERFLSVVMGERISDQIYEYNSRYQQNLVEVIKRTPKRTVANYIFFQLVIEFIETPSEKPEKLKQACVELTKKYFAKSLDNMFYRRYNNEKSTREIESMWRQMKSTFDETLRFSPALDWIEQPTRDLAIAKLQAMTLEVNNYSEVNFTEEFEGLNMQSEDFVENVRYISIISAKENRVWLHKPGQPFEAGTHLSYTPANILIENVIKIPVALLQPFYIWSDVYPNAVMFGTLASLIGHELIHGFDDSGRKFDDKGNSTDWWDEKSSSNFLKRRECFTKQYGRYVYDGIQLKESTAQSENIADNGGTRLAYAAYRKWFESQITNSSSVSQVLAKETLPNLRYSANQLFFISFAQVWCNDAHPSVKALQVSTDQHMPGKFRVIGSLSNFEEFSKEFNCPAGAAMNPKEKCILY
ncbi:neprilysin-4-like [Drosophila teissieri]|uniref:neprilysin-4-like n=1 Tax=Drosophila teissieri TaxID=7243 RepID=UPI001CB9E96E|nr:neprilysin-4-like [Drosophila teissieri]